MVNIAPTFGSGRTLAGGPGSEEGVGAVELTEIIPFVFLDMAVVIAAARLMGKPFARSSASPRSSARSSRA